MTRGSGHRAIFTSLPTGNKLIALVRNLENYSECLALNVPSYAKTQVWSPREYLSWKRLMASRIFIKAVRRIPGMEWMAEWEEEAIDPDENFYKETDPEGALRGRLYLVMFNREAMN